MKFYLSFGGIACNKVYFSLEKVLVVSSLRSSQWASSTCSFRSTFFENRFRQVRQWYGKLSEWVCIWNFRLDILLKARLHWLQRNGFSPVWIIIWFRKFPFWWNPFPQMSQMKAFLSLCVRRWVLSVEERLKLFPHSSHLCGFFLCVNNLVPAQGAGQTETFSANVANKWPTLSVIWHF